MAKDEVISTLPEDMIQGGLIDDLDVTFQNCTWRIWDYNGQYKPRIALRVEMVDEDENIHEQYFSAADPKEFAPSQNECFLTPLGDKKNLNKGSNYEALMLSVFNEGFPKPSWRSLGTASLNGMNAHVIRKPAPVRKGLLNKAREDGSPREDTQLLVSKINWLPGEGPKAGKAAKVSRAVASGKGNGPQVVGRGKVKEAEAEPEAASDADTDLMAAVVDILGENGGSVTKKGLTLAVFKRLTGEARKKGPKRVIEDDFLAQGQEMGLWEYDGEDTVTSA